MSAASVPLVHLRETALRDFCHAILRACGVPENHAALVSESLIAASLRGVDSHGIQLLPTYAAQLDCKAVDPFAIGKVVTESGACLTYDGQNGLGQVVSDHCTDHALRLVKQSGLAMVVARNSNHFGAAAWWGQKLARGGAIGLIVSNASPAVPPWQGRSPRLGTNPICMAVPNGQPGRWLLDMATTTVALGKVSNAAYARQPTIPAAWGFLDSNFKPTTDTEAANAGFATPFGTYKGSGLSVLVEILCAVLGGGPMSQEVAIFRNASEPLKVSHTFLAIDPARFLGAGQFEPRMDRLQGMLKSSAPAPGFDEVLLAGEPEWRTEEKRRRDGIPVPVGLWEVLTAVAQKHGVVPPPAA